MASASPHCAYQVFLSFRGKDIGKTFADYLYRALVKAGFHTFRDDDHEIESQIERAENIDMELRHRKAMESSRIFVIVFSKGYASSRWCLDQLVKIVETKKIHGRFVFPVFYDVDPSHIRKQSGIFAEAFAKHEEELEAEFRERREEWMERVKRWREALTDVANLGGKVLGNEANGHEARFIERIIEQIEIKLNRIVLNVAPHPIGIDTRVENINLWLQDGSTEVGLFVIHGKDGIGKTTIAKTAYNLNFDKFERSSFLANIREASHQQNGLVQLQRQFLSDILNKKADKIYNLDEGILKIKVAVSCKRVLVVLDDVDQLDQMKSLLGMQEWLYSGSKIIVTTRNERLIKASDVCKMYKAEELDERESIQLFSWHAFGQEHPDEGYVELTRRTVQHCRGVPSAIQELGSSMSGRSVDVWENAIKKLEAIANNQELS